MADKVTWIVFRAHAQGFVADEDFHPDFFGTFVCPVSRTKPEELLEEVLRNQKLALVDIRNQQKKSPDDEWGIHERLKSPLAQQGYGLAIHKVQPWSGQMD